MPGIAHQGIVTLVKKFTYTGLDHIINTSNQSEGQALLIATDHITDEGNLGALIRTAAFFGVHGLIIPKDRSAAVTARVLKRASGAYMHIPVARVINMARTLDLLRKNGFWVIGSSDKSPDTIYEFDWNRNLVLVLGNEQQGLSRTVQKRCHHTVGIPALGHIESLNVSVACGVILSEIVRQRTLEGKGLQGPH